MGIHIAWDKKASIAIRIDIIGDWTWQEYNEASIEIHKMIDSVSHPVYLIADFRKSGNTPRSAGSIQYVKRARDSRPENYAGTINIGADVVARTTFFSGTLLSQRGKQDVHYVDTLEAAYNIVSMI
ncbi:MAG: hypothetical protein AAFR81_18700 [Chloroflexota bacterium]